MRMHAFMYGQCVNIVPGSGRRRRTAANFHPASAVDNAGSPTFNPGTMRVNFLADHVESAHANTHACAADDDGVISHPAHMSVRVS